MESDKKIPDHILEKSKELAWSAISANENYFKQRQFAYYIDDKCFYTPYYPSNFDLHDLAVESGIYSLCNVGSYLKPIYKEGMIEGFVTLVDVYRDKRQTMKAGKYLKKIFPFATDIQIEKGVAYLKAANSPLDFELIVCDKPESFEYAYKTLHVPKQSPRFDNGKSRYLKRLDSSCMRGEHFEDWKMHPARVYGCGDLQIVYAKEKLSGKIGARVVVYPDKKRSSYIYTANDAATELLVKYLDENGFKESSLDGARVSKIEYKGQYLMPYVDDSDCCDDCGDYFVLGGGNIRCQSTEGVINLVEQIRCDDCDGYYDSDDMTEINGNNCICIYCRDNNYTYSSLMGEYISNDDAQSNGDGECATERYFERNDYILDYEGVWQLESECVEYDGEYYHQSSYYVTRFEGNYYHKDSQELIDSQDAKLREDKAYQVTMSYKLDWKKIAEYNASPFLAMVETKERALRQNYQLDSNGIPERLPELDLGLVDIDSDITCVN